MRPRHLPHIPLFAGEYADVRPAVGRRDAQSLSLGYDDVGVVVAGGPEHRQGYRVRHDDQQRAAVVSPAGEDLQVLHVAQKTRLLYDQARRVLGERVVARRHGVDPQAGRLHVGGEHVPVVRRHRVEHGDTVSPGQPGGHEHGFGHGRRSVVHAGVGDLHPGELAHHRLELVVRLQRALGDLGLVRRVAGHELAAGGDLPHHSGDEVAVRASAQEGRVPAGRDVLCRHGLDLPAQLELRSGRWQVQLRVAVLRGDVGKEVIHGVDADSIQHGPPVGVGVRRVG